MGVGPVGAADCANQVRRTRADQGTDGLPSLSGGAAEDRRKRVLRRGAGRSMGGALIVLRFGPQEQRPSQAPHRSRLTSPAPVKRPHRALAPALPHAPPKARLCGSKAFKTDSGASRSDDSVNSHPNYAAFHWGKRFKGLNKYSPCNQGSFNGYPSEAFRINESK